MYNRVVLVGNLAKDPELRHTPAGVPVCRLVIAVNRQKAKDQEDQADFINLVAWRKLAEICGEYLKKGRPVAVEGVLQIRSYKGRDGKEKTMAEVTIDNMQMLGKRPEEAKAEGSSEETPF